MNSSLVGISSAIAWRSPRRMFSTMSTAQDRRQAVSESLSRWRARSAEDKRVARRSVVIDRVVSSMAMENEPVSPAWVQQAKQTRA